MKQISEIYQDIISRPYSRRSRFLRKCQKAVDEIYSEMKKGGGLSPRQCVERFTPEVFYEIVNETRRIDTANKLDNDTAIKYMYESQYFDFKRKEELRPLRNTRINVFSLIASVISLIVAILALNKP